MSQYSTLNVSSKEPLELVAPAMAASTSSALLMYCLGLGALLLALAPQWQRARADDDSQVFIAAAPLSPPLHTPGPSPVPINCTSACAFRCSKAGHLNSCLRACGTCCARCHCVPPGTSGNQEVCGTCYTQQRTHDQELKCP